MRDKEFATLKRWGDAPWTPKTGKKMRWRDMDCGHLRNTVRWLRRKADKWSAEFDACYSYIGGGGGEFAEMYAEHAADDAHRRAMRARDLADCMEEYLARREAAGFIIEGP